MQLAAELARIRIAMTLEQKVAQLGRVGEVAVVGQGDGGVVGAAKSWLGVLPGAATGRGVSAVANGQMALERAQAGLVEDLRDQTHVLVDHQPTTIAGRDAGRLLAAMLQGIEPEVGQLGDVLAGGPDSEDPTGVLGCLLARKKVMGQSPIAACHVPQSPTSRGPVSS